MIFGTRKLKRENKRKQTLDIGLFCECDVERNIKTTESIIFIYSFQFQFILKTSIIDLIFSKAFLSVKSVLFSFHMDVIHRTNY